MPCLKISLFHCAQGLAETLHHSVRLRLHERRSRPVVLTGRGGPCGFVAREKRPTVRPRQELTAARDTGWG